MNKKRFDRKHIFGLSLFLLGFAFTVYSCFKITGFVVSQEPTRGVFFIGIVLVMGGILLMNFSGHNKLEIKLYRESNDKGHAKIYMTDPENFFGNGTVTLKQIKELGKDPESLEVLKSSYFIPLMEKYNEGGTESELAKTFLVELGFEPEQEELEKRYALPKSEIVRIKKAFISRKDKITLEQKKILKDYNLVYKIGGDHAKISPEQGGRSIIVGLSPSDVNAGRNNSSLLLKLCDEQYRQKNRKK